MKKDSPSKTQISDDDVNTLLKELAIENEKTKREIEDIKSGKIGWKATLAVLAPYICGILVISVILHKTFPSLSAQTIKGIAESLIILGVLAWFTVISVKLRTESRRNENEAKKLFGEPSSAGDSATRVAPEK